MGDDTIRRALSEIERDIAKMEQDKAKLVHARNALLLVLSEVPPSDTAKGSESLAGIGHREAIAAVLKAEGKPLMPGAITEQLLARGHKIAPNVTRANLQLSKGTVFERVDEGWRLKEKK